MNPSRREVFSSLVAAPLVLYFSFITDIADDEIRSCRLRYCVQYGGAVEPQWWVSETLATTTNIGVGAPHSSGGGSPALRATSGLVDRVGYGTSRAPHADGETAAGHDDGGDDTQAAMPCQPSAVEQREVVEHYLPPHQMADEVGGADAGDCAEEESEADDDEPLEQRLARLAQRKSGGAVGFRVVATSAAPMLGSDASSVDDDADDYDDNDDDDDDDDDDADDEIIGSPESTPVSALSLLKDATDLVTQVKKERDDISSLAAKSAERARASVLIASERADAAEAALATASAAKTVDVDDEKDGQQRSPGTSAMRQIEELTQNNVEIKNERDDSQSRAELLDTMVFPTEERRRELQEQVTNVVRTMIEAGVPVREKSDNDDSIPFWYCSRSYTAMQQVLWNEAERRPMTLEEAFRSQIGKLEEEAEDKQAAHLAEVCKSVL